MLSLYEILKASKTGIAPDMWTALAGMNWGGADSGHEVKELTGIPPLSFTADGTPLLDYLISGNMEQSNTPTPDSPIQPQETGERTGNVMPAGELKTVEVNGITFSSDGNGRYRISGTATAYASARFNLLSAFTTPISVSNGGQGTLSFFNTQSNNSINFTFCNGTTRVDDWRQTPIRRTSTAYNAIGNKYVDSIVITVDSGATIDMTITPEFTNDGVLPSEFEPYGIKIPISSANTATPVYLGEVETTRKIKKFVLTGEENIDYSKLGVNSRFTVSNAFQTADYHIGICSHYKYEFVNANNTVYHTSNNMASAIFIFDNNYTSATDFKAYLAQQYAAGTPVTVWYVLVTEETGIVNEPLRKIGDYADTVSYEQAQASIPTLNGQTVVDVDTTLKPSQMYIKYQE